MARKPSFWMDNDVLVDHWARHNNDIDASGGPGRLSEEELYEAYKGFCVSLFDALCTVVKYHGHDGKPETYQNPTATIEAHVPAALNKNISKDKREAAIYAFMADRTINKANGQLKNLQQYNKSVKLPYGYQHRNWVGSAAAQWKDRAGKFN